MIISMDEKKLNDLIQSQLCTLFLCTEKVDDFVEPTLKRLEKCFYQSANKYYKKENEVLFSPYNSSQYSIFLYYLSNTAMKLGGSEDLCSAIYYLNKALNSVDWYFELELPDVFGVEHPLGSVLGRAKYSNYFYFYQNCTVGGIQKKDTAVYPTLGEYVTMCSNSSILGDCNIGSNVVIGSGTLVKNQDIPDNSIVFGSSPELIIKKKPDKQMREYLIDKWMI